MTHYIKPGFEYIILGAVRPGTMPRKNIIWMVMDRGVILIY